jgi:hypothetical protein
MAVTSPPHRLQASPTGSFDGEQTPAQALIEEARRRARRRRWGYAAAVIGVVGALAVTLIGPGGPSEQLPAAPAEPAALPLGVPSPTADPAGASTLVTSFVQIHVGYAYVYADGQVIWYRETPLVPDAPSSNADPSGIRRLDRPRTRTLTPKQVVVGEVPDHLWVEPTSEVWTDSDYAVCLQRAYHDGRGWELSNDPVGLDVLPVATAAQLAQARPVPPPTGTAEAEPGCFFLLPGTVRSVLGMEEAADPGVDDIPGIVPVGVASGDESESVLLWVRQVLPHGEMLVFGG